MSFTKGEVLQAGRHLVARAVVHHARGDSAGEPQDLGYRASPPARQKAGCVEKHCHG